VRSGFGEEGCDGAADAAGGSGNDSTLIVEAKWGQTDSLITRIVEAQRGARYSS